MKDGELKRLQRKYDDLKNSFSKRQTLIFTEADDVGSSGGYKFCFTSFCSHHAVFKVVFDSDLNDLPDCVIKVNGLMKLSFRAAGGKNEREFDCKLVKGDNDVEVIFSDVTKASGLIVSVYGAIENIDLKSRISVMQFNSSYLTVFKNGAKGDLVIEHHDGEEDYVIIDCPSPVSAAAPLDGTNFVFVYGDGRNMRAKIVDTCGDDEGTSCYFSANASSFVGAAKSDGLANFYAIERGTIKKYSFDDELDLTVTDVGISGGEVFPSSDSVDKFIVVGFDGRATLVLG